MVFESSGVLRSRLTLSRLCLINQSIQYKATTDLFKKSRPNNETAHFDLSSGREEPYTHPKLYPVLLRVAFTQEILISST